MNRTLWNRELQKSFCPPWPCSACGTGTLKLRQDSLIYEETVESKREHREDYWGPEFVVLIFSCWADCINELCQQSYSISGTGSVDRYYDQEGEPSDWIESFSPKHIIPTLDLIGIPAKCPPSVRDPLREAFALYWTDSEACAGRLRTSLEALLTHIGVPTTREPLEEKGKPATLHSRIEVFAKQSPDIAKHLMAIKWQGNSGSHGKTVGKADLLDAFELLENALTEILEKRSYQLALLAEKLTARHRG